MAHEEQSLKGNNINSTSCGVGNNFGNFGKSSRKHQKQKKVPQRGLGVAQLERIRIEEQRKKEVTMAATPALSPARSVSQATVPSVDSAQSDGAEVGRRQATVLMPGNVPKMWNSSDMGTEFDNPIISEPKFVPRSNWRIPGDSDAIFPFPAAPMPRINQNYLNHPSLMNLPSVTWSLSSSIMNNFHIEPPSNQTYHSNFIPPIPSEIEKKMVGMKRSCPFPSSDNSPAPPLRSHSVQKLNEPSRGGSGSKYSFELRNNGNIFREAAVSGSTRIPESNPSKNPRGSAILGEVLTLTTPTAPTWKNHPKFIEPPPASFTFKNYNFHDPMSLPYQTYLEEPTFQLGPNRADRQQQFYTFFPPTKAKESQANHPSLKISNGEPGEYIDLNLKL